MVVEQPTRSGSRQASAQHATQCREVQPLYCILIASGHAPRRRHSTSPVQTLHLSVSLEKASPTATSISSRRLTLHTFQTWKTALRCTLRCTLSPASASHAHYHSHYSHSHSHPAHVALSYPTLHSCTQVLATTNQLEHHRDNLRSF